MIDHHKSALSLDNYDWGYVVVEDTAGNLTSATSLFYEYLISMGYLEATESLSEFVELVRQYDTWEWEKNENQKAHSLNSLFYLVSIDDFEETMIERLSSTSHFDFDEFEKRLLNMEEDKIERYIRRKKREIVQVKVRNHFAGVVYAESYHSELGNELGKEYSHLDFIVILNMGGKRISYRTIHDHVDVAEIAAHYGGGGHQKASGSTLTNQAYKHFVLDTFQLEPIQGDAKRNRYNIKNSAFGTLYKNRNDDILFIYPKKDVWVVEKNKKFLGQNYSSFDDAEKFIKRKFETWLVKDDLFVDYLIQQVKKK